MLCPNCYGRGWRGGPVPENVPADVMSGEGRLEPCDYPGCHNGHIDCCDGLIANEDAATGKDI